MLTKEKARKILDETVEYYMDHPRCIVGNSCRYYDNGNVCAVGRLANKKQLKELHDNWEGNGVGPEILKILKFDAKDEKFMQDLQHLHDESYHWIPTDTGQVLSTSGKRCYDNMVEKIENTEGVRSYGYKSKKVEEVKLPIGNEAFKMETSNKTLVSTQ